MAETLKPCPFCGGEARLVVCDSEGNVRDESYEADPYSGLSYAIVHGSDDCCGECPISTSDLLPWLYETREEAAAAWNRRAERAAAVEVSHGRHGAEPRFPGDCWTMHHVCSACGKPVDRGDGWCRHCGARFGEDE